MHDAVSAKHDGRVFDLIRNDLTYVHEDFTLRQVLAAFQRTGQHLAIVINSFEEFVGVITFDNLIRELLGEMPAEEYDNYENRAAIAAYKPKQAEPAPQPDVAEEDQPEAEASSPEATEVVE